MKINIYYGGRGLLDDPTLYVISKIEKCAKGAPRKGGEIQYL